MVMKLVFAIGVLVLMLVCTGCSSATGWRVELGVAPVNAINDQAVLTDKSEDRK